MITDSERSAALPLGVAEGTIYFIAPPSMLQLSSLASRLTVGGLLGACAWPVLRTAAPWLPEPLRFLLGWFVFTIGPGLAVAGGVSRNLDALRRLVVVLGAGSAATPLLIDLLG